MYWFGLAGGHDAILAGGHDAILASSSQRWQNQPQYKEYNLSKKNLDVITTAKRYIENYWLKYIGNICGH